jgi:hypothetical protein
MITVTAPFLFNATIALLASGMSYVLLFIDDNAADPLGRQRNVFPAICPQNAQIELRKE